MLKSHMDAIEDHLVAISKIPQNSGHSLHKGTPREAFIREFLEGHLPANVAIGTGEIIDSQSRPGQERNQFDIVVYRRSYPKLDFGGGISGFLIESVIATIEVKSQLTKSEFTNAAKAARNAKSLTPNVVISFHAGYIPPKVLNYIIAYDGPAHMQTVQEWVHPVYEANGIPETQLPLDEKQRVDTPADAIDAVFVLNKGFLYFDNIPRGFSSQEHRKQNPTSKWIFADTPSGNLLLFFLFLQAATANIEGKWLNIAPYLSSFGVSSCQWGA
jgi:hypothetical protein